MTTNGEVIQTAVSILADSGNTDIADALARLINKNNTNRCFAKAALDEPLFILRGQDKLAPKLVARWADKAKKRGAEPGKVIEALNIAAQMREFKPRRNPT